MPTPINEMVAPAKDERITASLEPAHNAMHDLLLIARANWQSGLSDWILHTAAQMSAAQAKRNDLVLIGLHFAAMPRRSWRSFPAYLQHLRDLRPEALRDKLLNVYARMPERGSGKKHYEGTAGKAEDIRNILGDWEEFLSFLNSRFDESQIHLEIEREAFAYLNDPAAMKKLILDHLESMWETHLEPHWGAKQDLLAASAAAFNQIDYGEMSRLEAARFISGHPMEDDWWPGLLASVDRIIFVPNANIGPYVSISHAGDTLWLIFGARLPEGARENIPELSHTELLVRLKALADDTRLRILRLISERGEVRSQDVIEALELSQSATSRHLNQLSATGYLLERRCDGAKCYQLNAERISSTFESLGAHLGLR